MDSIRGASVSNSILDLADDLFENVLESDESGRAAVLVDDDRHVDTALLKVSLQVAPAAGSPARRACHALSFRRSLES